MSILVVSVSHKTAPVDVLAALTLDPPGAVKLADGLMASEHIDEVVVLSTCNRTEVYAAVSRFHGSVEEVTTSLADVGGLAVGEVRSRCAVYFDEGAVAHTFSVASGLDSMAEGETQILGQVRAALTAAQGAGVVGTTLNALFQQALRVGKRVQAETSVGSAGRSLVSAAYALLTAECGPWLGRRVLVVGAGVMAGLAARTAAAAGASVTCVNRTFARAHRLADSVGGRALPFAQLGAALAEHDFVVTCTGAADVMITAEDLAGTPVVGMVDLALPADVETDVRSLGVTLVNLELLKDHQLDTATAAELETARELVRSEVADFLGLRRAAAVAPTVVALRSMASEVVAAEMVRLRLRLPDLGDREREEVQRTVRRVVDKLLHAPTVRVQELAADPQSLDYAAALRELFALDPQAVAAVLSPPVP
ncbi:MAG: glutamyl-tRNA reductase [Actinomycetes bacterium]